MKKYQFWLITFLLFPFFYIGGAVISLAMVKLLSLPEPLFDSIIFLFGMLDFIIPKNLESVLTLFWVIGIVLLAWPASVVLYLLFVMPWLFNKMKWPMYGKSKEIIIRLWLWIYGPMALLGMWLVFILIHDVITYS